MITEEQRKLLDDCAIDRSVLEDTVDVYLEGLVLPEISGGDNIKFDRMMLKKLHNKVVPVFKNFDYTKKIGIGLIVYQEGVGCDVIIRTFERFDTAKRMAGLGIRFDGNNIEEGVCIGI